MQMHNIRNDERLWYPAREIIAMIHNTAAKNNIKGKDVIELSRDQKEKEVEWDDDLVRKILNKWN